MATNRKGKKVKARLPMEMVQKLRHAGGAQSSKKGKRGYNRKRDKHVLKGFLEVS